jgi:hypothetical protein
VLPVLCVGVGGLVIASVAFLRVHSLQRKLTTLSRSYWELRYDFGRLRARLAKIDGGPAGEPDPAAEER